MAIDLGDRTADRIQRLRRVRRVGLVVGSALSVLLVLTLRHCSSMHP